MIPFILISTRGGMDVLTFRDSDKAAGFCSKLERLGVVYTKEVF